MATANLKGGSSADVTASFNLGAGYVESAGNVVPVGREAANGNGPIIITGIRGYVAGYSGAATCSLEIVGKDETADFSVADGGAAALTSYRTISAAYAGTGGGTFTFRINHGASVYFGRDTSGLTTDDSGNAWDGDLSGGFEYAQAPSAPRTVSATPQAAGEVLLDWAAPLVDGDSSITGYKIQHATNALFTGATSIDVGTVTSRTITGLTPGLTYYFRVAAKNDVTTSTGTTSVYSSTTSALLGNVPGAPTSVAAVAAAGAVNVTWVAPVSDGGVAISSYSLDYATAADFSGAVTVALASTARSHTLPSLTPGATYYVRVAAVNSIGSSAESAPASATVPARTVLDIVQGASLHVSGGVQVELRSDAATPAVVKLYATAFGAATVATELGTLSGFYMPGGPRNLSLVADPAGNLYLVGVSSANTSTLLVWYYARTGTTTWAAPVALSQALTSTGNPIVGVAAAYAPGTGSSPVASILVLARRAGTVGAGGLSFAVLDLAALAAGTGTLFRSSGNNPSWLSTPPASGTANTGIVDAVALTATGTRLALLADGFAVVDLINGAVTPVAKAASGTATVGPWARVVAVSSTTFVVLSVAGNALAWSFVSTSGSLLGSGTYSGANAWGGAFAAQWDALYDSVANVVTVYYIADDSSRKLEVIDLSPITYAASAATVLTSALGAVSATHSVVRLPHGVIDERRVVVAAAALLAGVKSTALYIDTSGNVAPSAPTLTDVVGFDATVAQLFTWAFGDSNPADTQTAYELQIQRVSDSVNVLSTGKQASTVASRTIVAASLTNGVDYRWRVRTYDALDVVGTWSAYDTFTTSAAGTLAITTPAADNPAGLESADVLIAWTYTQGNGYVQTQRRVKVVRVSDSVTLSDTTMQASAVASYTVTALPTDVPVRIEVSIVTNAPATPTIGPTLRLLTTSYGSPMTPTVALEAAESYVIVTIDNPAPTGSRPEVTSNLIERRVAGSGLDFEAVATVAADAVYFDHAVASGEEYEYRVIGATA